MSEYEPIWEGWKDPPEEDERRPWRLVIQPKPKVLTAKQQAVEELRRLGWNMDGYEEEP